MRYVLPPHVNKNHREMLNTTDQRILADISDKMQEMVRLNNAILEKLGGSLKKEKKEDDEIVELLEEEKERTGASAVPTNKEKKEKKQHSIRLLGYQPNQSDLDPTNPPRGRVVVPAKKGKKKWQPKPK